MQVLELVRECCDAECEYPMDAGWHGGRPGYGHGEEDPPRGHWACTWDLAKKLGVDWQVLRTHTTALIRAGLMTGCEDPECYCRGDFEIEDAGRELLKTEREVLNGA
jgi:hypothetical protein